MDLLSASDVRKNWSLTLDSVVHEKPAYVKRTHDKFAMLDLGTLISLLRTYKYTADLLNEDDMSVTLSLHEIDLIVNEKDLDTAKISLAYNIKEYAEEYYEEYSVWSKAANRAGHVPYVLKALSLSIDEIKEEIICRSGKN